MYYDTLSYFFANTASCVNTNKVKEASSGKWKKGAALQHQGGEADSDVLYSEEAKEEPHLCQPDRGGKRRNIAPIALS